MRAKKKHNQKDNIKINVWQTGNFVVKSEGAGRSINIVCVFSPTSDKVETAWKYSNEGQLL